MASSFPFLQIQVCKNCFFVRKCGLTAEENFKFKQNLIENHIVSQNHDQNSAFYKKNLTNVIFRFP